MPVTLHSHSPESVRRLPLRAAIALLVCGALSLACGGGGDGGGPNPVPTSISVTPAGPLTLASGAAQQLTATVLDQDGKPISGASVTWQTTVVTIAAVSAVGNITASHVGTTSITAHAGAITSNAVQVTVTSGPPAQLTAIAGNAQTGKTVGTASDTMIARLTDAAGNVIAGATIDWLLTSGTGTVTSAQTTTAANGTAGNRLTLGTTPGTRIVRATVQGTALQQLFSVAAIAGPALNLSVTNHFVVLDSGSSSLAMWTAQDAFGNPATLTNLVFTARDPLVASVSLSGAVTGQQRGSAVVVASLPGGATDSVQVLVAIPGGPALISNLTSFAVTAGGSFTVALVLDMRASGEPLGATTVQLDWDPAFLTYQSDADAGNGVGATMNASGAATGTLLLAAASANGFPGAVPIRTVTFQAAAGVGLTGAIPLTLTTTEVRAALSFRDLLGKTVAGSYPLVTQ